MLAVSNIPLCLELTGSLGACKKSFNGPVHVAVHGGGSHPCGVEQPISPQHQDIRRGLRWQRRYEHAGLEADITDFRQSYC